MKLFRVFILIVISIIYSYSSSSYLLLASYELNDDISKKTTDIRILEIEKNIKKERLVRTLSSSIKMYLDNKNINDTDISIIDTIINFLNSQRYPDKNVFYQQPSLNIDRIIEALKNLQEKRYDIVENNKQEILSILDNYIQKFHTDNLINLLRLPKQDPSLLPKIRTIFIDNIIIPYVIKNKDFMKESDITDIDPNLSLGHLFFNKNKLFNNVFDLRTQTLKRLEELQVENLSLYVRKYLSYDFSSKELANEETKLYIQNIFIDYLLLPWMDVNQRFPQVKDFGIQEHDVGSAYNKIITPSYLSRLRLFDSLSDLYTKVQQRIIILGIQDRYPFLQKDSNEKTLNSSKPEDSLSQDTVIDEYILPWVYTHKTLPTLRNIGEKPDQINISHYALLKTFKNKNAIFDSLKDLHQKTIDRIKHLGLEDRYNFLDLYSFNNLSYEDINNPSMKLKLQEKFIRDYIFPFVNQNKPFPKAANQEIQSIKLKNLISSLSSTSKTDSVFLFDSISHLKEICFNIWFLDPEVNSLIYPNINPIIFLTNELLENNDIRSWARLHYIKTIVFPFIKEKEIIPDSIKKITQHKNNFILPLDILFSTLKDNETTTEKTGIFDSIEDMNKEIKKYITDTLVIPWIEKNGRLPEIINFQNEYNGIDLSFNIIRLLFTYHPNYIKYIKNNYCISLFIK